MSEEIVSEAKLREIAERVLTFQRYIYRRAWATYYAVWSAAFVSFALGTVLPLESIVPRNIDWVPYAVLFGGVGLAALFATFLIFKSAYRTISLRNVAGASPHMGGRDFALVWVGFYAVVFVSFFFFQREALSILYALLFLVEIFIYYSLRFSFQDKTPFEGRLALASYGSCSVFGFFASLFFTSGFLVFGIAWGITGAIWVFCALYAHSHAPEELVELRY
jgi:hypothetical protein